MFHGDLGMTVNNHHVTDQLAVRAGVSLQLLLIGSIIGAIVGVILGIWGAVAQYRASDQVVTFVSYLVFATPDLRARDPVDDRRDPVQQRDRHPADRVQRAVLRRCAIRLLGQSRRPAVAPVAADAGAHPRSAPPSYSRYQRNAMLDVLGADYIRTARSKGLTRGRALIRHGVRVALIPMSTFFAYSFGTLIAGATLLELVFSWHGMGEQAIQSIQAQDINSVAGATLFVAVLILCSSTLSEVLYAALDPRVRR